MSTYIPQIHLEYLQGETKETIQKYLIQPHPDHSRTIRIVTYRSISIETYTSAVMDALRPKLKSIMEENDDFEEYLQNLQRDFKTLNPDQDIEEGTVIEMTIKGDTMSYWSSVGGTGEIKSKDFCRALCLIYYSHDNSSECVSPEHRDKVIEGILGTSTDKKEVDVQGNTNVWGSLTKGLW